MSAPQIISASRRTDIPAFYTPWFVERLKAGYVLVPNPLNPRQVSRVSLDPADVLGIVFWSKNPRPLLEHLAELDRRGINYYLQFTITCYPRELEPRTPDWESSLDTFLRFSDRLGPARVVWRYDPIILSDFLSPAYHLRQVERTAERLRGAGERLVISFLNVYRKTGRNLAAVRSPTLDRLVLEPDPATMQALAMEIAACAAAHGFQVETCAEEIDVAAWGIRRGRCIDPALLGLSGPYRKDSGQREACGCTQSRDIGMYDSCLHGCAFCYANSSDSRAIDNRRLWHRLTSEYLLERPVTSKSVREATVSMAGDQAQEEEGNQECGQLPLEGWSDGQGLA